jgi:hypothetical protein
MSMSKSSLPAPMAATTSSYLLTVVASPASFSRLPRSSRARALVALVALTLPGLVCASCLNPQDDYDAYAARAADAQVPLPPVMTGEASTIDVASLRAPDSGFDDTNGVLICLSQLAQDVSKALLLKVSLKYTPDAMASNGGTLAYQSQWLPAGSTDDTKPLTDPGSEVGQMSVTINASGFGTVTIPTNFLPAAGNGITNAPVQLSNVTIAFHVESSTQICANLGGTIPPPEQVTLNPPQNPCIYLLANSKGQWGTVQTADIHCP